LAYDLKAVSIRLPVLFWRQVLTQLRRRGAGRSESGAFLLGPQQSNTARVTAFICYDDLDPDAHQGAIAFHAVGYAALWAYCKEKNFQVLADVHTHPGTNVQQSLIDQKNPMLPVTGHTALIVPNFGRTPWWTLNGVGVYEYLGNFKWQTHNGKNLPTRVKLTPW
jgi:proteasome lid subunit RPN8/RPN11